MLEPASIFPNGARAAVSFTYDDGLPQHLDNAIPDLEAAGVVGTFYIATKVPPPANCWATRPDAWRAAARAGHEIGNHTEYHPCSVTHPWVKPNFSLEAYSLPRMESELLSASREIEQVTGDTAPRSFAYCCCEDFVGPNRESFRDIVGRLVPVGRGGSGRELVEPYSVDWRYLPSWAMSGKTELADAKAFVDEALETRQWAIFLFHGVGGGHHYNVERGFHRELIKHVALRSDEIACGTVASLAQQIRPAVKKPW